MVINFAYEGVLKSQLTVNIHPKPIATLEEFATKTSYGDIYYGSQEVNTFLKALRVHPNKGVQALPETRTILPQKTPFQADLVKELFKGNTIISNSYSFQYTFKTVTKRDHLQMNIEIVPEVFRRYSLIFRITRMNRFFWMINKRIGELIASGIAFKLIDDVINVKTVPEDVLIGLDSLKLDALRIILVAFGLGSILASVTFIGELISARKAKDVNVEEKGLTKSLPIPLTKSHN